MGKFKDWVVDVFGVLGTFLIGTFIAYASIFGIIHSARHHTNKDLAATIFLPPWAWWRSIELFWHINSDIKPPEMPLKELDSEDPIAFSDEQLTNDLHEFLVLFENANNDVDEKEFREYFMVAKRKIDAYPEDKRLYLANGIRVFQNFAFSIFDDLDFALENFMKGGEYKFILSNKSALLKSNLKEYKLDKDGDELLTVANYMSEAVDTTTIITNEIFKEFIIFQKSRKEEFTHKKEILDDLFRDLFHDEL